MTQLSIAKIHLQPEGTINLETKKNICYKAPFCCHFSTLDRCKNPNEALKNEKNVIE